MLRVQPEYAALSKVYTTTVEQEAKPVEYRHSGVGRRATNSKDIALQAFFDIE